MKVFLLIISIILGAWIAHQFLPWYAVVLVAALLGGLFNVKPGLSFFSGFLGGFLLWGAYALYLNSANAGILATRMGWLLGGLGDLAIVLATGLLGAALAGLGALTGALGRQMLEEWKFFPHLF